MRSEVVLFFFQAEDGIRDLTVTGVQTCALPISSVADRKGTAGASAYSATKAALRSLARTAAAELAGRGIRVNTVAPGPIVTPIFGRTGLSKEAVDEFAKEIVTKVPMKRFGQPEE